jgi:hypothetical protein
MQNHATLKSKTRRVVLARDLNSQLLYVEPGYGHNQFALSKLRRKASHMVIQQFKGNLVTLFFHMFNAHSSISPL